MSQPQAILQYVSGIVSLPVVPEGDDFSISAQVNFYLVNRGIAFQTAVIRIWTTLQDTPSYEDEVVVSPSSGTCTVVPESALVGSDALGWAYQWAEIRTSSPDLVPSCGFYAYPLGNPESGPPPIMFYFAPGDFAQFTLQPIHLPPPGPPIPPIEL